MKNDTSLKATALFKIAMLCFVVVMLTCVAALARADDAVIESIDGNIITLSTGEQIQVEDTTGIQVGDDVEVDKTYTVDSTGVEGEEY